MSFKDITYLELCHRCSAERNHLCNFGTGHHKEHFRVIIFLEQWFSRGCGLNIVLI